MIKLAFREGQPNEVYLPDAQFCVPSDGLQPYVTFSDPAKTQHIHDWFSASNIQVAAPESYVTNMQAAVWFIIIGFANVDINAFESVLEKPHRFLLASS
ncbi:hypothetical protein [Pectobacterium betavasculorum]|uniref:Uncharacterized protein n=1 Tax=Pectobacterium betavasculorum TaxID=55207 RepID=A0ABR4V206_9GAMM|nr:hypothetical protein [Pectobacterium betavasculorum]KFX21175.1 hypothetical protein JV35_08285 [Pectobacterium betavasculorum]